MQLEIKQSWHKLCGTEDIENPISFGEGGGKHSYIHPEWVPEPDSPVTKKDFEGLGKKIVSWVLEDRQTWVVTG